MPVTSLQSPPPQQLYFPGMEPPSPARLRWQQLAQQLSMLLLAAGAVGLLQLSLWGVSPPPPAGAAEAEATLAPGEISVRMLLSMRPAPVIVDARAASQFARGTIPGAFSIPPDGFDSGLDALFGLLPEDLGNLTGKAGEEGAALDRDFATPAKSAEQPEGSGGTEAIVTKKTFRGAPEWVPEGNIVVFCDGAACEASAEVAARLREALPGTEVFVLKGGWDAWTIAP